MTQLQTEYAQGKYQPCKFGKRAARLFIYVGM